MTAGLPITEGDHLIQDFRFASGESLPLRLHYRTLGKPRRDAQGRIDNAVLILHGTTVSGATFLEDRFAGELFGPGQPLDANRFFIILPDGIGHGGSSKPSDGLRAGFPQYAYADMVAAQFALVTEGLAVNHLRLLLGTSMGGMQTYLWGITHPDFMDALMPLACLPVQIAGRNRLWRELVMQAIRTDLQWLNGDYDHQPQNALRAAMSILLLTSSAPIPMQLALPTREHVDRYVKTTMEAELAGMDANDLLYQINASRDYDPSRHLEKITAPLLHVNTSDDFINPPELGIAEREIKRIKNGRFVLIPGTASTRGHGTHTSAAVWSDRLVELLAMMKPHR